MHHKNLVSAVTAAIVTLSCVGLSGCASMGGYYAAQTSQQQPSSLKVLHPTQLVVRYSAETLIKAAANPSPYVQSVTAGQPAAKAGIQAGDLIVKVAGEPTPSIQKALELMNGASSQPVIFTVRRAGADLEIPVTLAATAPRLGVQFGVQLIDRDSLLSLPGRDDVFAAIDQVVFGVLLRESQAGVLFVDVLVSNGSDRPIRIGPDEISVRAYGVSLRRLSPEEAVNINHGSAMATLGIPMEQGTYVSQSVIIPSAPQPERPLGYQINSTATTSGTTTYGRATVTEIPSGGGLWGGIADGLQAGLAARAAREAAAAQAMPYMLQEQRRQSREQLLHQYTEDLIFFQRNYLSTASIPPQGRIDGLLIYDNARFARPLEFVISIGDSKRVVEFQ